MGFFEKIFGNKKNNLSIKGNEDINKRIIEEMKVSEQPDKPSAFGYKTSWISVASNSTKDTIIKLGLETECKANWGSGLQSVYDYSKIFVSPVIEGYVFIIGIHNLIGSEKLNNMALLFDELYYFSTHRVIEYHCWAKYEKGNLIRGYGYSGESGEVSYNEGELTEEEISLGFKKFPLYTDDDNYDYCFPDEDDVLKIAAAWNIDTSFSKKEYSEDVGYICREH